MGRSEQWGRGSSGEEGGEGKSGEEEGAWGREELGGGGIGGGPGQEFQKARDASNYPAEVS